MPFEDRPYTAAELRTALLNLQWIIAHKEGGYFPESETIVWGDGGSDPTDLLDPDFTPATMEAHLIEVALRADQPEQEGTT